MLWLKRGDECGGDLSDTETFLISVFCYYYQDMRYLKPAGDRHSTSNLHIVTSNE